MAANILVVEDEPAIQELIAVNLQHAGHHVMRAGDAEGALGIVKNALPDLLLIDWMLPEIPPTGKVVEMAVVVVVGFKDGKISHEHIYWDQASVLVQIGLLDPSGLPVVGAESARRILNPKLPPRSLPVL